MVVKSFESLNYGLCTQCIFLFILGKWLTFDKKFLEGILDDNWSAWLIFSDKLSAYQENLFHLIDFIRQVVSLSGKLVPLGWFSQTSCLLIRGTCSFWVIFPDKLSPHGEIKDNFLLIFSLDQLSVWNIKEMIDCSIYGYVFPYMLRGNKQLFVTTHPPLFFLHC